MGSRIQGPKDGWRPFGFPLNTKRGNHHCEKLSRELQAIQLGVLWRLPFVGWLGQESKGKCHFLKLNPLETNKKHMSSSDRFPLKPTVEKNIFLCNGRRRKSLRVENLDKQSTCPTWREVSGPKTTALIPGADQATGKA